MTQRTFRIALLSSTIPIAVALGRETVPRLGGAGTPAGQGERAVELFAPGIISTPLDELAATFTPNGDTIYFAISSPGPASDQVGVIVTARRERNRWSHPVVASFSGQYSDYDPFIAPDGKRLFFASNRPTDGRPKQRTDYDIWMVERDGNDWGAPHNLGAGINSRAPEFYPSIASDGTLYFSAVRADSKGHFNIYRSRLIDGQYGPPENTGAALNGGFDNIDNVIAPDQGYIVFASYGRPDGLGNGDLYISFNRDGVWTPPRNLGAPVNSVALDYTPNLSPDGRYLYWASNRGFEDRAPARPLTMREIRDSMTGIRNGNGNIYRTALAPLLRQMSADPISVGGRYLTTVTLLQNSCGNVTIEQHETVVTHTAGSTRLSLTHAGNGYDGTLRADGTFNTAPKVISASGGDITIRMSGAFASTALDDTVVVSIARATPCEYRVRWRGAKDGAPSLR